jgi:hypothetical protein
MSRPELVKLQWFELVTSAPNVFSEVGRFCAGTLTSTDFARAKKNGIGNSKIRNLDFGTLSRTLPLRYSVVTWAVQFNSISGTEIERNSSFEFSGICLVHEAMTAKPEQPPRYLSRSWLTFISLHYECFKVSM